MRWLQIIFVLLITASCSTRSGQNKFSDPVLVKIFDLQDRRATDSLLIYLRSENPVYRRASALSFASVQDSTACVELGNALLEDPDAEVRRNAAFALGQTGGFHAINALIPSIRDKDRVVSREALEALGKTVNQSDVNVLSEFQTTDTVLAEGHVWGFYQLALRKKANSTITSKASEYLKSTNSYQTRLGAAHYFGRSQKVEGKGFEDNLINAALHDKRPEVRMAAVSGLRHVDFDQVLPTLTNVYHSEKDYRVRVGAVRVCQNFPGKETQSFILEVLNDSVEMVQVAASEVIRNLADKFDGKQVEAAIARAKSPRVKSNLFASLLKSSPPDGIIDTIKNSYLTASVYFKAALLSALGESKAPNDEKALEFLSEELLNTSSEKVILTSSAAAIVSINQAGTKIPNKRFLEIYQRAIEQGDVAVIGIVSSALRDETLRYKEEIKDLRFLHDARAKLSMPRDVESLEPLERAIAYLEEKEPPPFPKNTFNHPIDWKLVKTISVDQKVEIVTTKGTVVIRLLVEETPGTVANFVQLVSKKYFDGMFFHRVVPNFVIQAGCTRGDGYGSEDYSIRSGFSLRRYSTGSVGMASAGKDTEGTQWFITHSPTPHLDGKYTIFAETIKGMDIVHRIEVGDRILEVKLVE